MDTGSLFDFWREIPGLPDYEVSRDGRIHSRRSRKQLKTFRRANGYMGFNAFKGSKPVWPEVHRCLALAFHGEPPTPSAHAAHKDGNRSNNTDHNVTWKSPNENAADRKRHGTSGVRLTIEQRSLLSRLASQGVSASRIAQLVGCNHSTVRRIRALP